MHILEASLVARNEDGSVDIRRLGEQASSAFYPLFYVEGLQAASLFYVSQAHGLKGANAYFAGTAEAGAEAIGRGYRAVRRGEVDVGARGRLRRRQLVVEPDQVRGARASLEPERAAGPTTRARRHRARRGRGVPGARARGVGARRAARACYAEIAGFGSAYDTHALITPAPGGPRAAAGDRGRAARGRRDAAGRRLRGRPRQRHRRSATQRGARAGARLRARRTAPRSRASRAPTGHLVGAAGALNAAVAALAVAHRRDPADARLRGRRPGDARSTS